MQSQQTGKPKNGKLVLSSLNKQFISFITIVIIALAVITFVFTFWIQTEISNSNEIEGAKLDIIAFKDIMVANQAAIEDLKTIFDESGLAKVKAFRKMIELNPEILDGGLSAMQQIAAELDVDEVHVIDEKGIIRWGNIPGYYGYDFASSEQTQPFLEALENDDFELAQESQPNGATGILFQYIGVTRLDEPGIIQIGITPDRLDTATKNNRIEVVAANYYSSSGRTITIIDEDGTILHCPDSEYIGSKYSDYGISDAIFNASNNGQFLRLAGKDCFVYSEKSDGYTIISSQSPSIMYQDRLFQLIISLVTVLILLAITLVTVKMLLKARVTDSIDKINSYLNEIRSGKLDINVDVRTNTEFASISDGINSMIMSIKDKISVSDHMIEDQKILLSQMLSISDEIDTKSDSLSQSGNELKIGSDLQNDIIDKLSAIAQSLNKKVENTILSTQDAMKVSEKASEYIKDSNNQMMALFEAMDGITSASNEISAINKTIESISFQTNILALNAAVEAARAGVAGKGFGVVADEVRNLAKKSDESAKYTAVLIQKSVDSISEGKNRTDATMSMLKKFIKITEDTLEYIYKINQEATMQIDDLNSLTAGFDEFLHAAQTVNNAMMNNSLISVDLNNNAKSLRALSK